MPNKKLPAAFLCLTAALSLTCCTLINKGSSTANTSSNSSSPSNSSGTTTASANNAVSGVEKVKPAPGTGNVQGKVLFDGKPAENIRVKLCEKFSQYVGGCDGQTYTAQTDKDGVYVITNAAPKVYEGLLAYVFDTNMYIFQTAGSMGLDTAKYEVTADKTLFVHPINLFKSDLKTSNPKAGAKVSAQNLELKWETYPDAAYYKFSVYPDDASVTSPYVNQRVEATSYTLDKPLQKGTYRWQVEAYNSSDVKLAESADDIKFTVTDGASQ
jgi:5-hydroxyisourate hydrolase-like protein (transthyretin family)